MLDIFKVGLDRRAHDGSDECACTFTEIQRARLARGDGAYRRAALWLARADVTATADRAILLGLEAIAPSVARADRAGLERIRGSARLRLAASRVEPDEPVDLLFHKDQTLPLPERYEVTALDAAGGVPPESSIRPAAVCRSRVGVRSRIGRGCAGPGAPSIHVVPGVVGGVSRSRARDARARARE